MPFVYVVCSIKYHIWNFRLKFGYTYILYFPAILVFAAVAAEGHQNTNMANSIDMMKAVNPSNEHFDMNVYFPWALLLCGKKILFWDTSRTIKIVLEGIP